MENKSLSIVIINKQKQYCTQTLVRIFNTKHQANKYVKSCTISSNEYILIKTVKSSKYLVYVTISDLTTETTMTQIKTFKSNKKASEWLYSFDDIKDKIIDSGSIIKIKSNINKI